MLIQIHLLIIALLIGATSIGLAGEASNTRVIKLAIEDASVDSKVLGVETYYGLIIGAQSIKNVEKPKNVKVEEIINSEILKLKGGMSIEVRDLEFVYIKEHVSLTLVRGDEGKHPNVDEGASGTR